MAKDISHILSALLGPRSNSARSTWCPAVDVYQLRDGWLIKYDLAGVKPTDIEVRVEDRRLTVRGRRRDWIVEEACSAYSMEISYDQFERVLELPCSLDDADIRTDYRDGMLLVRLSLKGSGDE